MRSRVRGTGPLARLRRHPRTSADIMVPIRIESYRFYYRQGVPAISARGSRLLAPGGPGYYRQGVPAGSWLAVDTFPLEGCSVTVNSAQIGM